MLGLRGVNRRLYDAGQQYALAQGTGASQLHMTIGALALALLQLPFLLNLAMSLRRGATAGQNPWEATTLEWEVSSPPPPGNFSVEPRVHRGAYDYSAPGAPRDFATQGEPA
jgi:cytochrome c oxidase subunit 1